MLSSEEEEEAEDDSDGGRVGVSRPVEVGEKTSCFKPLHMTKSERVSLNTAGRSFFPQQKTSDFDFRLSLLSLKKETQQGFHSTTKCRSLVPECSNLSLMIYVQAEINIKILDIWR